MSQNSPLKGGREKDLFSFSFPSPAILVKGFPECWLACTSGLCLQTPSGGCGGSILSNSPSEERDQSPWGPLGPGHHSCCGSRVGVMEAMWELARSLVGTWRWSVLADAVVAAVAMSSD